MVCLPRAPRCSECPLRPHCASFRLGTPENFPEPRPRRATEPHFLAAAVLQQANRVALVRGLDDGLLNDLWNFPSAFGPSEKACRNALAERLARSPLRATLPSKPHARLTHRITHRKIQVSIYVAAPGHKPRKIAKSHRRGANGNANDTLHAQISWTSIAGLRNSAISRLCEKISAVIFS